MKIDLSELNESYHSANVGFAGALPNGIYQARLINAEVTYSKRDNLQIKWIFEAQMPSGQLGTTMKFSPLVPQSMCFLQADLRTLGIVLDDLNELYVILRGLTGTIIEIEIEDNIATGFPQVSFIRKISRMDFD